MKKVLSILLVAVFLLCAFSISAFAAGGMSVSTGSLSLKPGESTSFTVTASNCAGAFSVSSSDSSVASVSVDKQFLDNDSATVTVTAKGNGSATISIRATDMATMDEEDITGQIRTVSVNVSAPATTEKTTEKSTTTTTKSSGGAGNTTTTAKTTTTTKADDTTTTTALETTTQKAPAENELSEATVVVGRRIPLQLVPGTHEYEVTVPYGSNTVIVDAVPASDAAKVEVVGAENISDGSTVTIVVTGKDEAITNYHVKIHYDEPQIKEVPAKSTGMSKGLATLIAALTFLIGLLIGGVVGFLLGKKKYESYDYYGGDGGTTLDYSSTPSYPAFNESADADFGASADDYGTDSMTPFATTGFNFSSGMGLNYDYNKSFENEGYLDDGEAVSLRDPVYTAPDYEAAPEVDLESEPMDIPPAFEASAPEPEVPAASVEPVAEPYIPEPVAEPVIPDPVAPVEPAPAAPEASSDFLASMRSTFTSMNGDGAQLPAAEPEPVAEPVVPEVPQEDADLIPEPMAQPYIDDAPPALPYEPGTAFGSVPFEQSAD